MGGERQLLELEVNALFSPGPILRFLNVHPVYSLILISLVRTPFSQCMTHFTQFIVLALMT